ncbi:Hypothetical predicted protein [Prunus dulcis]|uniref:Reverse transcriptase zinc-binding domain-containing protein n=1 Tax=Prunus dulcis TaxID=3755 RepID=A0A5E4G1S5_PRUDU|nr:Hypothetical predicted protein [Prunus dulcis]
MYLSPHWCALCNKAGESADHLLLPCPFSLKLWGKKAKILWGSLMQAVIWNLWLECNRRIFEDYKGVGVVESWDRVKFWAALWASTSLAFKDISYPTIMHNLLAVVY